MPNHLQGSLCSSSLLASLDNPVEDNLVLVQHIQGLLVPHKLVLVYQALQIRFDIITYFCSSVLYSTNEVCRAPVLK